MEGLHVHKALLNNDDCDAVVMTMFGCLYQWQDRHPVVWPGKQDSTSLGYRTSYDARFWEARNNPQGLRDILCPSRPRAHSPPICTMKGTNYLDDGTPLASNSLWPRKLVSKKHNKDAICSRDLPKAFPEAHDANC
jgi:hypothetical protein